MSIEALKIKLKNVGILESVSFSTMVLHGAPADIGEV